MNNLIEFKLENGEPLLLDPSFIREVSGGMAGTIVTVERKNSKGEYVTYHIPIPLKRFSEILHASRKPGRE